MGQEEEAAAAPVTVFSWEKELRVSKQTTAAVGGRDGGMPDSPRKAPPARRLSVPPPPGRLPSNKSFSRARAVRPEDDPFLAAYLACTKSTGSGGGGSFAREARGQRRFTWAGLGLGLGLSCKSSNAVVEGSMVKKAKLPEVHPKDA
ncbi:uncharacterized protein LOC102710832 [Oryza brachyantha]|uniref:Uncharacterized protein n=1 Tax=Oryza brachyantha TaxID=4533 RepID=J3NF96_ORYBR|nr:uncharacterized protein LOC102710832 [Oryza brachyantha]